MPFFTQSAKFSIKGSSLTDVAGDFNVHISTNEPTVQGPLISVLQGRKKRSSGSKNNDIRIIKRNHLELRHELHKGVGYRLHSARTKKGKAIVIKVFEGPLSQKRCATAVAFSQRLWHSNLAQLVGTSEESSSTPFAVFSAEKSTKKIQSLIAMALPTDLCHSVGLTLRMVKGIAAGLHYIGSQNIPLHSLLESKSGLEKFVILCSDDGEPVLAIDPSEMGLDGDEPPTHHLPIETDNWLVFDGLCERTFNEINSIRYNDVPERMSAELYDAWSSLRPEQITELSSDTESIPELEMATSASQSQHQAPRREILWKIVDRDNQSLETVSKEFGEYLEVIFPLSNSPLPRVTGSRLSWKRIRHKCPGYLREEITLTSDIAKSAIVSHTDPMVNEICLRCGKLMELVYEEQTMETGYDDVKFEDRNRSGNDGSGYRLVEAVVNNGRTEAGQNPPGIMEDGGSVSGLGVMFASAFPTSSFPVPTTYSNQYTQPRSLPSRYDLNPAFYSQWPQSSLSQLSLSFPNYETHDRDSTQQSDTVYSSRTLPLGPILTNPGESQKLPPLAMSANGYPGHNIRSPTASYLPVYAPYSDEHETAYSDHIFTQEHMPMDSQGHPDPGLFDDVEGHGDYPPPSLIYSRASSSMITPTSYTPTPVSLTSPDEPTKYMPMNSQGHPGHGLFDDIEGPRDYPRPSSTYSRASSSPTILPLVYTPPPYAPTSPDESIIEKKHMLAAAQLKVLNETYARTAFPSTVERAALARHLDMTARGVQIWFRGKRQCMRQINRQSSSAGTSHQPLAMPDQADPMIYDLCTSSGYYGHYMQTTRQSSAGTSHQSFAMTDQAGPIIDELHAPSGYGGNMQMAESYIPGSSRDAACPHTSYSHNPQSHPLLAHAHGGIVVD